jgi:hypothetical protein
MYQMPDILTASSVKLFAQCPAKYCYRMVNWLVPKKIEENRPLSFGSAAHSFLAHRLGNVPFENIKLGKEDQAKLKALARSFRWDDAPFEFPGVAEKKFEVPIPNRGRSKFKFALAGKIDLRSPNGEHLVEHKTASLVNNDYVQRVNLDLQVHLYAYALKRLLGALPKTIWYSTITVPKLQWALGETDEEFHARRMDNPRARRRKEETEEEYIQRCVEFWAQPGAIAQYPFKVQAEVVEEVMGRVSYIAGLIRDSYRTGYWFKNDGACTAWNRTCEYLPLCSHGAYELYEEKQPFEELADSPAETQEVF